MRTEKQKWQAIYELQKRELRRAQNLCISCGKFPPRVNATSCSLCLDKRKTDKKRKREREAKAIKTAKRRAECICKYCGKSPLVTKTSCQDCYDKKLKIREKRINDGLCVHCHKNYVVSGKNCENCKTQCGIKYKILKDEVYSHYGDLSLLRRNLARIPHN